VPGCEYCRYCSNNCNINWSKVAWLCFVAALLPVQVRAIVDEPLTVTCIIPDHLASVYDSSQLAFEFEKGYSSLPVDDGLIARVNNTVAVLNYSGLSSGWNDSLVGCYVKNSSSVCGSRPVFLYCTFSAVFLML